MGLVDLRDRVGDPSVQWLLENATASEPSARRRYVEGDRALVGWSEADELVGCLGAERLDEVAVRLHTVFVAEPFRRRGVGRALVEAVVAGAPAETFLADADDEAVGFFASCGFAVSRNDDADAARGWRCVRSVSVRPAPAESVRAVTLAELERAIRDSWGRDTSADADEWSPDNPARGQCDATAVLVRAYLGGDILIADVLREGKRIERHAWNQLPSGLAVDLTRDQFRNGEQLGEPVAEDPLALGDAERRHALLAERVAAALGAAQHARVSA